MSGKPIRLASSLAFGLLGLMLSALGADEARVVATVNGEKINSEQLEAVVQKQIAELNQRARQVRQTALIKLIDNLLLEQAARAAGMDTSEYLKQNVESVTVPPSDVDAAYDRSRSQFPGVLPGEAKYRIRRTLEDNRRATALTALLERLRRGAQISNQLVDDRMNVLAFATQEGPSRGDIGAKVTILEFSDFECPYCRAAQPVISRVLKRWPGRVRLVFRHFPLDRHANALPAAQAGVCADRQDRFWAVHDRIFASQSPLSSGILRDIARDAGLDSARFDSCIKSTESLERVQRDILLGRTVGVSGTPAFFVNGQSIATAAELELAVAQILGGGE